MAVPFETVLECFLWDLVDEGIDEVLDRIKGEIGVSGVEIPVHARSLQAFRPHAGVSPRRFEAGGGAHFQPDATRYAGTRLRPVVSGWLRKSNPLSAVVKGCRDRGLKVAASVGLCNVGELAGRLAHAAAKDVFGQPDAWLCPANPDVQEYARCLLADLRENYGFDAIRLGQMGFPGISSRGALHHVRECQGFRFGRIESWLRTLCFCESCRQLCKRDGVDIEAAAACAFQVLEQACATGTCLPGSPIEFAGEHPELRALLDWRSVQLTRWLASLHPQPECTLLLDRPRMPIHSGIKLQAATSACDVFCVDCRRPAVESVDALVRGWTSKPDRLAGRLSLSVSAGKECPDPAALVACLVHAARSGCHSVRIRNYGLLPIARLEWIRQAVRFAHREAR